MNPSALEFERRYQADSDPWDYLSSGYEREKYAATLAACGPGPADSALELGGSIGVFSAQLAARCRRLTSLDFSPTAVDAARVRLSGHPHAEALLGVIPDDLPPGRFDLVLASEVLYYLTPAALIETLSALRSRTRPGARFVCVHWRPAGPERPSDAAQVHALIRDEPWLRSVSSGGTEQYLLDVLERR